MRPHIFLAAVIAERARADKLHPNTHRIPNGTGGGGRRTWRDNAQRWCDRAQAEGHLTYADIADEEFSEVLACDHDDDEAIEKELVQVSALCLKWIQEIHRRRSERTGTPDRLLGPTHQGMVIRDEKKELLCPWCGVTPDALLFGEPPLCSACAKPVVLRLDGQGTRLMKPEGETP